MQAGRWGKQKVRAFLRAQQEPRGRQHRTHSRVSMHAPQAEPLGCRSALLGGGRSLPSTCLPHKRPCACCWSNKQNTRVVGACRRPENTVTMNAEEGWAKPLHCGLGFFPQFTLDLESLYALLQRVNTIAPALFYLFLPYQFPLIPVSED